MNLHWITGLADYCPDSATAKPAARDIMVFVRRPEQGRQDVDVKERECPIVDGVLAVVG